MGGGAIFPPDILQALHQKLEEPVTWFFLTFPKYVYTLTSKKKIVMWTLTNLLGGVLNRPVKIFCAHFGYIYIFYDVLFGFYHFRCLNILKFGHRILFCDRKFFGAFWLSCFFAQYFYHIWPAILYCKRSCAGQRVHDSKCLNEVYKAYIINHILHKKLLVKPNWVKIRQTLGGQYWR